MSIAVSIIIPARNAAETIGQTLESVIAQTHGSWEAIVINDDSVDATVELVEKISQGDSRIRYLNNPAKGLSNARNLGVQSAKNDWLLFLDADDWIGPAHLERMTGLLQDESLDAVICGWKTVAADGTEGQNSFVPAATDLFPLLVRSCAFIIHACIVRRQKVYDAGLFDPSLSVCIDWDLWQRVARAKAKFGFLNEVHAYYRMQQHSVSRNRELFFEASLRILRQGYSEDSRVTQPDGKYRYGLPSGQLEAQELYWACWCAGMFIAEEEDACFLLSKLSRSSAVRLSADYIASNLFDAVCRYTCSPPSLFHRLWERMRVTLGNFLLTLEAFSGSAGLEKNVLRQLEFIVVQSTTVDEPLQVGKTFGIKINVAEPLCDIISPAGTELLCCIIEAEGERIGPVVLPFIDGTVSAYVLKDAVTAKYAWPILQKHLALTVYNTDKYSGRNESPEELHNLAGWEVFLQQLWDKPDWDAGKFGDPTTNDDNAHRRKIEKTGPVEIEISEPLPDLLIRASPVEILYSIGGLPVDVLQLPVKDNLLKAQQIRAAICLSGGFELCRICVREALLEQPFIAGESLREKLQKVAGLRRSKPENFSRPAIGSAPNLSSGLDAVISRRKGMMGSSAFRRAALPSANYQGLLQMANAAKEEFITTPALNVASERVLYKPEVFNAPSFLTQKKAGPHKAGQDAQVYGRHHFEILFSKKADPWEYTHPYEQKKYEQTLSLLENRTFKKALEIACAEGHFTVQLAPRVEELDAVDISQVALARAAERCKGLGRIRFERKDFVKEDLPGTYDLIVCSEVLYYVGKKKDLDEVALKFAKALRPGGYIVMAHGHQVIDDPGKPGFDWGLPFGGKVIGERFAKSPLLRLAKEIRTPLYRIQLFERSSFSFLPWKKKPEIDHQPQPFPVKPIVAPSVRWNGEAPLNFSPTEAVTERLPVLMYHQVLPKEKITNNRFQIGSEVFELQLQYLQNSGYYSATWESWLDAMQSRTPLKGRAVAFTFDDGTTDFYEYAWPLLKKYGFGATVFLVTERTGKESDWELGKKTSLLDWPQIKELHEEGVEFGSHSATHRSLTALTATEVVEEASNSRTALTKVLQTNVNLFAYPFGDTDGAVQHLVGACGYTVGFATGNASCRLSGDFMNIPRLEIKGSDTLEAFICTLSSL